MADLIENIARGAQRVRVITQADVDASPLPLRLEGPGKYVLGENITVAMRPEFRSMTVPEARSKFAVLAIEGDGVELDLQGYTISMTEQVSDLVLEGASLIELGNTPYPTGVFPETFPGEHVPATNVTVRNGALIGVGHFGVHGVGNHHVLLEDLVIGRVGVGGITLSAVESDIHIRNCRITGTNRALRATLDDLTMLEMDRTSGARKYNPKDYPPRSIVPDGSLITGIHINGQFNVHLQPTALPEVFGKNILIEGCEITEIVGTTTDYGAWLSKDDRKAITTLAGSTVHASSLCPHLTMLGKAQLEELGLADGPKEIPSELIGMGVDVRGHLLKGVHGIRVSVLDNVRIINNRIAHIENRVKQVKELCISGTAVGVAIRACGNVDMADNDILDVVMPSDPTRAALIFAE